MITLNNMKFIVSPHVSAESDINCHVNLTYVFQFLIVISLYNIVFPTKFMNVSQFHHSHS